MVNPLDILKLDALPDTPLVRTESNSFTRHEILGQGAALAKRLDAAGVTHGSRVIVSLDSGPSFIAALTGCWLLGAVPVLLDPQVRREMDRVVGLTQGVAVIRGGTQDNSFTGNKVIVPDFDIAPIKDAPDRRDDTPLLILFTSGSTGAPTLVPKTFEQLDVEVRFLAGLFDAPKRVATMAPWCHIFGLILSCLLPARTGGLADLGAGISPKKMLELASSSRADLVIIVPAVMQMMVKYLEAENFKIPAKCRFVTSGAPLSPKLRERFTTLSGCGITDLYGSTEAGGVAFRRSDGPWLVQPHVETRLVDGGFLEVRSASVSFPGKDGFYRIGDIVRFEGDGFVLKSRSDDVVKIGGRRTSLREIVEVMEECEGVTGAACLAAKVRGALRLVAFATVSTEEVNSETIRSFIRSRVSDHKVPGTINVVSFLPRTPAGKIDKRQLQSWTEKGTT